LQSTTFLDKASSNTLNQKIAKTEKNSHLNAVQKLSGIFWSSNQPVSSSSHGFNICRWDPHSGWTIMYLVGILTLIYLVS